MGSSPSSATNFLCELWKVTYVFHCFTSVKLSIKMLSWFISQSYGEIKIRQGFLNLEIYCNNKIVLDLFKRSKYDWSIANGF